MSWSASGAAHLKCNDRFGTSGVRSASQALGRDSGNNLEDAP